MTQNIHLLLRKLLEETMALNLNDEIDNEFLKTIVEEHLSGKGDRGRLLYSILVYKLWIKNLFERFAN